jgi:hypothetical protein
MRRRLVFTAIIAMLLLGTPALAGDADQPLAGQATLVGMRPLPRWGVLRVLQEGGFSGLFPVLGVPGQFWTLSDRGPNGDTFVDASGATRRPFFSPAFTPTIYRARTAGYI